VTEACPAEGLGVGEALTLAVLPGDGERSPPNNQKQPTVVTSQPFAEVVKLCVLYTYRTATSPADV
jgi:hypothetical protein